MATSAERGGQVLEFYLSDERYCVDIEYIEEIVNVGELTPIPNSDPHVRGVMDLRGRTTTIIDPRTVLGLDETNDPGRIVIFDPERMEDHGAVGWVVDEADRVITVTADEFEEPSTTHDDAVDGVIKKNGEIVIHVDPTRVTS